MLFFAVVLFIEGATYFSISKRPTSGFAGILTMYIASVTALYRIFTESPCIYYFFMIILPISSSFNCELGGVLQMSENNFPPYPDETPAQYADRLAVHYAAKVTEEHKKRLGQFFTPLAVAQFLASFGKENQGAYSVV